MNNQKDFGIEQTIKSEKLEELTIDLLDVSLVSMFENEILKEIPIFKYVYSLGKVGLNIRDRIFLKKLIRLLYKTKEIPFNKRNMVIDKINTNKKYKLKIGEKLIFIIDKTDELEKIDFISILFNELLAEHINYDNFIKGAEVINKTFIGDLKWFLNNTNDNYPPKSETHSLFNTGILQLKMETTSFQVMREFSTTTLVYEISSIGMLLKEYLKK